MTLLYQKKDSIAYSLGHRRYCGPIAVSVATGVSIKKVLDFYALHGRKKTQGSHLWQHCSVLRELGFKIVKIEKPAKTILTFGRVLDKNKTYLIRVRGHILCARYGQVHDWTNNRQHHIKEVYEVVKDES